LGETVHNITKKKLYFGAGLTVNQEAWISYLVNGEEKYRGKK